LREARDTGRPRTREAAAWAPPGSHHTARRRTQRGRAPPATWPLPPGRCHLPRCHLAATAPADRRTSARSTFHHWSRRRPPST
jgi:hypothetical protein